MADPMSNGGSNGGMNMHMGDKSMMCKCPHHKVMPWSFLVIGILWVLGGFGLFTGTWPMILSGILFIIMGGMKMKPGMCKCCSGGKM